MHISFLLAPQNRLTIIPKKLVHKIRDQGSLILEELMCGANHKVEWNKKLKDVESYLIVFPYVRGTQTAMLMVCVEGNSDYVHIGYDAMRQMDVVVDIEKTECHMTLAPPSEGILMALTNFHVNCRPMITDWKPELAEIGLE